MKILSSSACMLFRYFLVGFAALFFTSPCVNAEDLDSLEIEPIVFDSETLQAVTNLARSISGVNATQATTEDNVAAILTILQKFRFLNTSYTGKEFILYTTPQYNGSYGLGQEIARLLAEDNQINPSGWSSYSHLKAIQRILYGQAGYSTGRDSIQPTLLRIEEAISGSFTNRATSAWTTNDVDLVTRVLAGCDWENTINPWMDEMASYSHALAISMGYNTYDNISAQWVHEVNSDTVVSSLEDIAANVSGDHDYMSEIVSLLHDIYDLQTSQVELSETASNVVIEATAKAEQEGQEAEDEVEKSFDDVETEYPDYMMPEERGLSYPSDQSGLTGVSYTLNHGTTIKLLESTPAFSLPRMEIELFANGAQTTAIHNITTAVRLGWTALFSLLTFFLYLETYRRARAMLLHTQSAGNAGANLTLGFQSDHGVVS